MKHTTILKLAVCSTAFLLGTAYNTSSTHHFKLPSFQTNQVKADDFSDVRIQQHIYFDPSYKAQDVLNYNKSINDQQYRNVLDKASIKSMDSGKNVYQDSPADENDRVYNGQPSAKQNLELNIYTLNLLNEIYKQLGLNRQLVLNRSAMQMEQELANQYQKDNWTTLKGHDANAINTIDKQYEPYGCESALGGDATYKTINNLNINDYKRTIYNGIIIMLFGNIQSPAFNKLYPSLHNSIGQGEYAHAAALLGYGNTPDGVRYIGRYFAIGTQFDENVQPTGENIITIHIALNPDDITIPAGQPHKFNKNDNVTDTTEHFSSPSRIAQYKQYLAQKAAQHKQQIQDEVNAQKRANDAANQQVKEQFEQAEKQAQKFQNGNADIDAMIDNDIAKAGKKGGHQSVTPAPIRHKYGTKKVRKHHKRVARKHKKRVTRKRRKRTRKVKTRKRGTRKHRKRVVRRRKKKHLRRKNKRSKIIRRKRGKKRSARRHNKRNKHGKHKRIITLHF